MRATVPLLLAGLLTSTSCIVTYRDFPQVDPNATPLAEKPYPLYYDSLDEVHDLLTMARIEAANRHLREMDKRDLTVEHFIDRLRTFVNGVCTG